MIIKDQGANRNSGRNEREQQTVTAGRGGHGQAD
jgi:hypothetical protein